jgi:hypothetical protein
MKLRRGCLVVAAICLVGACSTDTAEKQGAEVFADKGAAELSRGVSPMGEEPVDGPNRLPYSADVLTVRSPGTRTALQQLASGEEGVIVRWNLPELTVSVSGDASAADMQVLAQAIADLREVDGVPVLRLQREDPEIAIHFVPQTQWADILSSEDLEPGRAGWTEYRRDRRAQLIDAVVVVDSLSTQTQRNSTIVHELLHALGPGHHQCPTGALYDGNDYDPLWEINSYDRELLAAWYSNDPARIADIPCPEATWTLTENDGQMLWCELTEGPYQPCWRTGDNGGAETGVPAQRWLRAGVIYDHDPLRYTRYNLDGRRVLCLLVEPGETASGCAYTEEAEFTEAELWHDGNTIYTYDPRVYVSYTFDDRRLLCEKAATGERARCQFTEGAVVDEVDAYSDGSYVYPAP